MYFFVWVCFSCCGDFDIDGYRCSADFDSFGMYCDCVSNEYWLFEHNFLEADGIYGWLV